MAALVSNWLRHLTSPLKPLIRIQRNLTGSKISMSSTKFVFFRPIGMAVMVYGKVMGRALSGKVMARKTPPFAGSRSVGAGARTFGLGTFGSGQPMVKACGAVSQACSTMDAAPEMEILSKMQTDVLACARRSSQSDDDSDSDIKGLDMDDPVISLVALQTFMGSWILSDELCQIIEKNKAEVINSAPFQNEDMWATCVALAWLDMKQGSRRAEWEMIAGKAMKWLQRQQDSGVHINLTDALEKARTFV